MTTNDLLNRLRNIKTDDLSTVMNVKPSMARKYKQEPWKYDPPTSKAIEVELAFGVPVIFWKDIKSYANENISSIQDDKQLQNKGSK